MGHMDNLKLGDVMGYGTISPPEMCRGLCNLPGGRGSGGCSVRRDLVLGLEGHVHLRSRPGTVMPHSPKGTWESKEGNINN